MLVTIALPTHFVKKFYGRIKITILSLSDICQNVLRHILSYWNSRGNRSRILVLPNSLVPEMAGHAKQVIFFVKFVKHLLYNKLSLLSVPFYVSNPLDLSVKITSCRE